MKDRAYILLDVTKRDDDKVIRLLRKCVGIVTMDVLEKLHVLILFVFILLIASLILGNDGFRTATDTRLRRNTYILYKQIAKAAG